MAGSGEHDPAEPLAPLPEWQLFANIATQSELLDEVAERAEGTADAVGIVDSFAVDSFAVDSFAVPETQVAPERPATPVSPSPPAGITLPVETAKAGSSPVTAPLVELGRAIRRSIFVPPLPTLREVAPDVEPAVREISAIGTDYEPGSLGRVIGAYPSPSSPHSLSSRPSS